MTLHKDLKEVREKIIPVPMGRIPQLMRISIAKVLRQELAWSVCVLQGGQSEMGEVDKASRAL